MRISCRSMFYGVLVCCVAGGVGCSSAATPGGKAGPAAPTYRGQEVNLVSPHVLGLATNWELLIPEWGSQSGATVRWTEYEPADESLWQGISSDSSGGCLVLFPLNRLAEIETRLAALPTNPDEEFDSRDLFKGLRDRALTRERKLVANPISVPVLLCYYRKDLLRAANLKPPETWDEYHALVASLGTWAPGLTAVEPLGPESRATTFFARSLAYCKHPENYSVWFEIDTAQPMLNTPGFARAIEKAYETWKLLPAESASLNAADCRRRFLSGKAAIGLTYEPSTAELAAHAPGSRGVENLRVDGIEIGVCRLPGSKSVYNRNSKRWDAMPAKEVHAPALCGFAGLASAVVSHNQPFKNSAAANLLVSLNSPALFDQAFAALPKSPCRESQLSFAAAWFGPELSAEESSEYCDSVAQSLRDMQLVFELPVIGAGEFRRAASDELEKLLRNEFEPQQTLEAMQRSFEAIVDRLGREAVRDSHRRGLGLGPAPKK